MQINLVCSAKHFWGKRCSGGKHSKVQLTGMATSNVLGGKILMFMIGKSASPRCFKHVRNFPCRYRSQKKAWIDGTVFEEWLHQLDRKFEMQGRKVSRRSGLKAINSQFLPPNTTSCTQLMDQGVIRCVCFIIFFFY